MPNMQPLLAAAKDATPKLHVRIEYLTKPFEEAYPAMYFAQRASR
jgi:hypothetical protein